jgi:phage gpG-like protein
MSVKPAGFRELQGQLIHIAERGGDAGPAFEKVARVFREDQRQNFARGGRPRWKPLSPEYAAWKARHGHSGGIGVLTGTLRDSFINAGDPYNLTVIAKDRLRVGSTDPVGNLFGGKHTVHKQPRRRPYSLTPSRRREYLQMVQDYLIHGVP